jgi:phosphohistidine phosphatase SixA
MGSSGYSVTQEQVPQHLRANRSALTRWFGRTVLTVFGWHVVGHIPNVKRVLIIAAPHTSNWDFVFAMAAVLGLNLRVRWLRGASREIGAGSTCVTRRMRNDSTLTCIRSHRIGGGHRLQRGSSAKLQIHGIK